MDISVIIPCFNDRKTLSGCIESVLKATTGTSAEIIVIDDGSSDGCEDIVRQYDGVRLIRTAHSGASYARNRGLTESKGDFITFLDADDEFCCFSDHFAGTIDLMRKKGYDAVSTDYIRRDIRSGKETVIRSGLHGEEELNDQDTSFTAFFTPGSICYVWNKVYRRDFLKKNHIAFRNLPYAEDRDFNAAVVLKGAKIFFSDEVTTVYHFDPLKKTPLVYKCFADQSVRLFKAADREKSLVYLYQAAYTVLLGLFFECSGKSMETKERLIRAALKDRRLFRAVRVLSVYPSGSSGQKFMRMGMETVSRLLLRNRVKETALIFSLAEHNRIAARHSPAGKRS